MTSSLPLNCFSLNLTDLLAIYLQNQVTNKCSYQNRVREDVQYSGRNSAYVIYIFTSTVTNDRIFRSQQTAGRHSAQWKQIQFVIYTLTSIVLCFLSVSSLLICWQCPYKTWQFRRLPADQRRVYEDTQHNGSECSMSHPHFHSCVLLRLKSSDALAMILQNLTSNRLPARQRRVRQDTQHSYLTWWKWIQHVT